jgi:hypothetical protein
MQGLMPLAPVADGCLIITNRKTFFRMIFNGKYQGRSVGLLFAVIVLPFFGVYQFCFQFKNFFRSIIRNDSKVVSMPWLLADKPAVTAMSNKSKYFFIC